MAQENTSSEENQPKPPVPPVSEDTVTMPRSEVAKILEGMAALEKRDTDREAQMAGLAQMLEESKGSDISSEGKLRERKNFEPKFRTVRIRKYPMAGDVTNPGFVVGWTSRGAYQEVDRSGVSPQNVDMIEVIYLGHEKSAEGKLQAEKIRLLDLLNKGEQVHCKIISSTRKDRKEPTGEEIDVTMWDPAHGLVQTGEKVDGYVQFSDIKYVIDVPGFGQTEIDALYCN